ncbi:MAG TPA: DinB family protein [Ohtaekwangia sp.]|nr:DinB family protein [Ohtaekwangia sp.]
MVHTETSELTGSKTFLTQEAFLQEWLGHRRLTRKVIEAFPEDKLFSFSVGGMRTFAALAMEIIRMGAPGLRGIVTRKWQTMEEVEQEYPTPPTKKDLLDLWDQTTAAIVELWPQISAERLQETDKVFGLYEGKVYWSILYFVDNEIHHRAQGFVYLRALGIEPPPFWDRY